MVQEQTLLTEYNIVHIVMTGLPPFYCKGIKIKDEMKAERDFHGGSHDALSITLQEREIEFELNEPKDHASLNEVVYRCRKGEYFTIVCMAEDRNGKSVAMERLDGCVIYSRGRDFGDFKAPQLTIKGWAINTEPINSQYD